MSILKAPSASTAAATSPAVAGMNGIQRSGIPSQGSDWRQTVRIGIVGIRFAMERQNV